MKQNKVNKVYYWVLCQAQLMSLIRHGQTLEMVLNAEIKIWP